MGYSYRWSKHSKRFRRENPLCAKCGRLGQLVDHIEPVQSQDDPGFWDPANHQTLCIPCHNIKTAEDQRRGRTRS
jgi:5-methylcytosine-specific restriction enzyme A